MAREPGTGDRSMGRTNPTFRDALTTIKERWSQYRRALRRRDKLRFDRLFTYAREHADASGLLNHQTPLFSMLLSIDLEQERRLDTHDERLDDLERAVETLQDGETDDTPTD
jgi:hypothetical protein